MPAILEELQGVLTGYFPRVYYSACLFSYLSDVCI
jgi:hypothetical protein